MIYNTSLIEVVHIPSKKGSNIPTNPSTNIRKNFAKIATALLLFEIETSKNKIPERGKDKFLKKNTSIHNHHLQFLNQRKTQSQ